MHRILFLSPQKLLVCMLSRAIVIANRLAQGLVGILQGRTSTNMLAHEQHTHNYIIANS